MDLKLYLRPIWKWKWLIVAAVLTATVSAYYFTRDLPSVFTARAALMVGRTLFDPNPNQNEFGLNQTLASAYASLAMREPVAQATMASLGLSALPTYNANTTANGQLLEISVTDNNPELAQAVANELARQVILQSPTGRVVDQSQRDFLNQQLADLQRKITTTQQEIDAKTASLADLTSASEIQSTQDDIQALETRLSALQGNYTQLFSSTSQGAANTLEVFEPASLPTVPVGPNKTLIILTAAAGGLLLSVGAAFLLELVDNTFRNAEEVAAALPYPILGYVGELERERGGALLNVADRPLSPVAESFRSLRTNLEFMGVDRPLKTIVVTSAGPGDGKTQVALNLAIMMAQGDKRVILVDADLRRSSLHRYLGLPNREGLSDLFRGQLVLEDVLRPWKDERLRLLTSGAVPPNPTDLLSSQRMDQLFEQIKGLADVVIVDSPPFFVADAWVLAAKVDAALFVVRPGYTRRSTVRVAVEQLKRINVRLAGAVLNRVGRTSYSPGTYLAYGYSVDVDAQTGAARPRLAGPSLGLQAILRGLQRRPEIGPGPAAAGANGQGETVHLEVLPPAAPERPGTARAQLSLDVLYAISRELASQLEMRDLLQSVLRMTLDSFGAASGSIIVLDEDSEVVEGVLIHAGQVQEQDAEQLAAIVENGLAGWVIRNKRPAVLDDTHQDERWLQRGQAAGASRSVISVPLMAENRVVGVLTLSHADPGHFTRDDLSMLTAIAVGLSTNSRAYAG